MHLAVALIFALVAIALVLTVVPSAKPSIGDAAPDGKFEFVVESFTGGVARVRVSNVGREPRILSAGYQKLIDYRDRSFEPTTADNGLVEELLDPGRTTVVEMRFDYGDAAPKELDLHEAGYSRDVRIRLE